MNYINYIDYINYIETSLKANVATDEGTLKRER